ncbi:MAG: hypothetical protein WC593_15715 [Methanoregula sp.]
MYPGIDKPRAICANCKQEIYKNCGAWFHTKTCCGLCIKSDGNFDETMTAQPIQLGITMPLTKGE